MIKHSYKHKKFDPCVFTFALYKNVVVMHKQVPQISYIGILTGLGLGVLAGQTPVGQSCVHICM